MASTDEFSHGSIYDEVYLAMTPLINLMRIHGLFPIPTHDKQDENVLSIVDNLKFSWWSKLLHFSLLALCGIVCCFYFVSFDYAIYMYESDPLEAVVVSINTTLMSLASATNLAQMIAQAPKWRAYFKQWQKLDRLLGITLDRKLEIYVKAVSMAYTVYASTAIGTVLYAVILKYTSAVQVDFTGDGFTLGLICYSIFLNGCQLLPEILFSSLAFAINERFSHLTKDVKKISENQSSTTGNEKINITKEIEDLRIKFQCLMDIIKSTNAIMGPTLYFCVIGTSTYMSTIVFMFFYQSLENPGVAFTKAIYSSVCIFRLISICFLSDEIKHKFIKFKRAIYMIPAVQLRICQESTDELLYLITCTKNSKVSITAWDFLLINKELCNKVAGAILTYTITIFEFYQKQEHAGLSS